MKGLVASGVLFFLSAPVQSLACAVCFGDPDSNQTKSAMAAVLVMGGITLSVLAVAGSVFIKWGIRARALEKAEGGTQVLP